MPFLFMNCKLEDGVGKHELPFFHLFNALFFAPNQFGAMLNHIFLLVSLLRMVTFAATQIVSISSRTPTYSNISFRLSSSPSPFLF